MSGPKKKTFPDDDVELKAFILFLYKYYIRLKWAVEKIRYRHKDFDPHDDEILEPIYDQFLEAERRRE